MVANALGVDLTTVIYYLEVSQLLIFVSCNMFQIAWQESLPTPLSTHTSLLLGRLSFYYATIAYHVGLNADLGLPHPGPTS